MTGAMCWVQRDVSMGGGCSRFMVDGRWRVCDTVRESAVPVNVCTADR